MTMERPIVLLIDGECNLCHWITKFVLKRDKTERFRFASLQSQAGLYLLQQGGLPTDDMDTFVMIQGSQYYTKSEAALHVFRHFGGLWPLLYAAIIVPRFLRDWIYDVIAGNRYRLFGHGDACVLLTPDLRSRFIERVDEVQER
ncbi:MAG: thiol-disulfide oxidoreductase DCC family protein [Candidatus Pristimantibacillus sp.]